jgi:tetratricopeptide (TPR) repeat protein
VTGVAGIGKSRLAWEFYKYFDGIVDAVYWHRGRCLAYGEGVTYWALADMVRMRCRITEDEDATSALRKLRSTLDEHILDAEERRYVEPRVAQLLGLGEHESRDRQDLFAAWRLFFERLADQYPTVLAFEDMQWADASLLDFVEYLLEWSRNHPLYVVTLARPELLERRPTWGAGHRNFTSLFLEPLSEHAMEELLTGLVPGLPPTLRAQILARAEGVPLYAVETVRMLLDRALLVQEGAVYRPTGAIEALDVPETLHALIAARLDGLSTDERRVLQDGAVLGKTFTRAALGNLSGRAEEDIEPLLVTLVRKEVLSLQADPRSPEHGQYGFLQDLVRHVAYETLSRHERKTRHLAAAEHLSASLAEDEVAEVVAAHLVEAHRAVPDAPDSGEIKQRARAALTKAGERASSLAAAGESQRYFEQAAELADEPADRGTLLDLAGQMARRANLPDRARSLLDRAHEIFESLGDAGAAARVSARLAEIDFIEGHPQAAVARLRPALATLSSEEPGEDIAVVAGQLGRFLILSGDLEEAAPYVEQALELAEALDLPDAFAQALTNKALRYLRRDRLREARILLEGALATALENDLHATAMRAYNNLAVTLDAADRIDESYTLGERAIEFARRVGDRGQEVVWLGGSVGILLLVGRWDEALARAQEASELAVTTMAQSSLLDVVFLHCERGEREAARELLERFAAVGESDNPENRITYAVYEARVLRAEGRLEDAFKSAERALAGRDEIGVNSWGMKLGAVEALEAAIAMRDAAKAEEVLSILDGLRPGELTPLLSGVRARFRGRLAAIVGGDAEHWFAEAETLYSELGTPFHLAVTQLEHAEWLTGRGEAGDAEPLLRQARETFERLRAKPWLERIGTIAGVATEVSA